MDWLAKTQALQRPLIAIGFCAVVGYLAVTGEVWAQDIVKGAVLIVIGFLFGERARGKADG